ncbi:hypothetical protein V5O48_014039 [Marasmius crinis-equi]|uniref:Peptidase C14 caspase domain-containing protein n=1 Tax=Marasmius crinis-equi TaxID=585013 RepID=A0ABR3EYT8_9AGAR
MVSRTQAPQTVIDVERPFLSSLFAVIVGINEYEDEAITNLQGAVKDAKDFELLLKEVYGVPETRIEKLINHEATREKVLGALEGLVDHPAIGADDPIVIYFAGHGSEVHTSGGRMQMLLPQDFAQGGSPVAQEQGITDRRLRHLLARIAKSKSDNITMIFDCCNSGSGTRENQPIGLSIRGLELPSTYTIPPDILEQDRMFERSLGSSDSETTGYSSHILLAACKSDQTAKENEDGGAFTSRLIALLRQQGLNRPSNVNVILQIEMPEFYNQNPQCEGMHKTRVLFDTKIASHRGYCVRASNTYPADLILSAGEAHGIMIDAEFAVYSDHEMTQFLGDMKAAEAANPFSMVLRGAPLLPVPRRVKFALLTCYGRRQDPGLRLHVQRRQEFSSVFKLLNKEMWQSTNISCRKTFFPVDDPSKEECDLALHLKDDGCVEFRIENKVCRDHGLETMPVDKVSPNDSPHIFSILRSAADFYRKFRHNPSTDDLLSKYIDVECFRVTERTTNDWTGIFEVAENAANLNVNGKIEINVDEGAQYGFKIHNHSGAGVFAALFYFNPRQLIIDEYYTPPRAAKGEIVFCIPPKGHLTIGYGENTISARPWEYVLPGNTTFDVGFLKLYISTEGGMDFWSVPQETPFVTGPCRGSKAAPKKRHFWHSRIIPIIQR